MSLENTNLTDRTRMVVDLSAIVHNYEMARKWFPEKKIMSVLKSDAYGHGIAGIAPTCEKYTDAYAVASFEEGKAIRDAGCRKPVLIFNPVPKGTIIPAARENLSFSIGGTEYLEMVSSELRKEGLTADCHIKIDTGFNRTGFRMREEREQECLADILKVYETKELSVKGIYTHMPVGDSNEPDDLAFTEMQVCRLKKVFELVESAGYSAGIRHAFATEAGLNHPDQLFDMVRIGMMIYGNCGSIPQSHDLDLWPVEQWTANIAEIEHLPVGESVGYGRTYITKRPTKLAVLSVGYGDGYRRQYAGMEVLCCGRRVPVIGRICMDSMMIDITDVKDAVVGTEVVLIGTQISEDGKEKLEIRPMELAARFGSTCGEVTGAISKRVPRYYR